MPTRGPAPKLGKKLGHRARPESPPSPTLEPSDGPRRPCPRGEWHREASAWWDVVAASAVAGVWQDADWMLAHRCLVMVDRWWNLIDAGHGDQATRMHGELRRLEVALYLSPAERARAGIRVDEPRPAASSGSNARARLRALDGGATQVV